MRLRASHIYQAQFYKIVLSQVNEYYETRRQKFPAPMLLQIADVQPKTIRQRQFNTKIVLLSNKFLNFTTLPQISCRALADMNHDFGIFI